MFRITDAKGFHITFPNGYTVSVQFGAGNYCDNDGLMDYDRPKKDIQSNDAEIAAWDCNGVWVQIDGNDVSGYRSPMEVLAIMNLIAVKSKVVVIEENAQ